MKYEIAKVEQLCGSIHYENNYDIQQELQNNFGRGEFKAIANCTIYCT